MSRLELGLGVLLLERTESLSLKDVLQVILDVFLRVLKFLLELFDGCSDLLLVAAGGSQLQIFPGLADRLVDDVLRVCDHKAGLVHVPLIGIIILASTDVEGLPEALEIANTSLGLILSPKVLAVRFVGEVLDIGTQS